MRSTFLRTVLVAFLLTIGGNDTHAQMDEEFLGISELGLNDLEIIFGDIDVNGRQLDVLSHRQMKDLKGGIALTGYKLTLTNLIRTSGIKGCAKSPACQSAIKAANSASEISTENSAELIDRAIVIQRGAEARDANFISIGLFNASLFARALSALRTPDSR